MPKLQTIALTVAACASVSVLAACGSSDDATTGAGSSTPAAPAPTTTAPSRSATASRLAEARRAVRTAARTVRHGRAYDIEPDRLRGRRVWEVKVAAGVTRSFELDVRADGRRVLRQRRSSHVSDDARQVAQAQVTLDRALKAAGRRSEGGRFDEAEIDRSRGRLAWEATFEASGQREIEVRVDARTGRIVAVTHDD